MEKTLLTVILTLAISLGGTFIWTAQHEAKNNDLPNSNFAQVGEFNCQQSGGQWKEAKCDCNENKYESETGYCRTSFGEPGGELGEVAKDLLAFKMQEDAQKIGLTDSGLPVVVYSRRGLLSDAEYQVLQKKLVNPFLDYHKDKGNLGASELVSLSISVPENIGEAYQVSAIFKGGITHDFLFGAREQNYALWIPDCLDGCVLSESYKKKYPEAIQ